MLILTIRTDKPEAEVGLFEDNKRLNYEKWQAHRELSNTIHQKIDKLLKSQKKAWQDVEGIVCFKGPGSFTGLRIGLTAGNVLAFGQQIPIVSTTGKNWIDKGIRKLSKNKDEKIALPKYGAPVNITKQHK